MSPGDGGPGGSSGGDGAGSSTATGADGGAPMPMAGGGSFCVQPTAVNPTQLAAAYTTWKSLFVASAGAEGGTSLRIQDPNDPTNPNRTVSEGIGYGMIIAAYMADRPLFDGLWAYEQAHLDGRGMMNWLITAADAVAGTGGATDADEDMAWALLIADKQWPSSGYLDVAKAQIQRMYATEVDAQGILRWGDQSTTTTTTHPDYFSPAYFRAFGAVTANSAGWDAAIAAGYSLLRASRNATTGLVPDLSQVDGTPTGNPNDAVFGYDACRTPWRVGIDWCFHGSADALAIVTPMAGYFSGVGAANVKGPVALDGTVSPTAMPYVNPEYTGPAGIAAMSSASDQALLDGLWIRTYAQVQQSNNSPNYFGASVGLIAMLVMSGTFVDYTP